MQEQIPRPLPQPNLDTQPYWDAAKQGKLVVQYCPQTGQYQHPPKPSMVGCRFDFEWQEVKGTGKIYSFTIVGPPAHPAFEPPYAVILVEIDDAPGVRIVANIKGVEPEKLEIGMPVKVQFETVEDVPCPISSRRREASPIQVRSVPLGRGSVGG